MPRANLQNDKTFVRLVRMGRLTCSSPAGRTTRKQTVEQSQDRTEDTDEDKDTLWDADEKCKHQIVTAQGGGIKCTKCKGWFCF